jgi:hypothetical protein
MSENDKNEKDARRTLADCAMWLAGALRQGSPYAAAADLLEAAASDLRLQDKKGWAK